MWMRFIPRCKRPWVFWGWLIGVVWGGQRRSLFHSLPLLENTSTSLMASWTFTNRLPWMLFENFFFFKTWIPYFHVLVSKWLILTKCFGIGPVARHTRQSPQGLNGCCINLWSNSDHQSYIHLMFLFLRLSDNVTETIPVKINLFVK